MTIRYTLLISYLLISLASALLITLMIFVHLREILRVEIEGKLKSQATTIMQQIDTTLFERMENMSMWNQLEVMQEIRVRDVDKRLSAFLSELQAGYDGVYERIFVVNRDNEIISASDRGLIGRPYQYMPPWLTVAHNDHTHFLQQLDKAHDQLYFSIAVPDAFKPGELGRLYASFDWKEIVRLLDAPLPLGSRDSVAYALLVDREGHIIATSSILHNKVSELPPLSGTLPLMIDVSGSLNMDADFLNNEAFLVGYAHSQGYRTFKGFGWRVLVLQPSKKAFAPMSNLWAAFVLFFCLTVLLGIIVSLWMSARIARPIVRLADFTRDFMRGGQATPPRLKSSTEITELSLQFSRMINNLEQSRQDIVRVAKLAVIGEMAASMAHEVRTPLGILRSSAQILQREPALSDIGHEMTGFILSETRRLNELITTLLECARPRPPQFTWQDLHKIIEHSLELLKTHANNKNIQLTTCFDDSEALIFCDWDQLIQVFLNLTMNALQHVSQGGRVQLSTHIHAGQLEALVCDDGAGIADADKSRVFDPFFTRRQDGIGLGLTVVQQIVLAHHGRIFVTDSRWGGACFHVILPTAFTDGVATAKEH